MRRETPEEMRARGEKRALAGKISNAERAVLSAAKAWQARKEKGWTLHDREFESLSAQLSEKVDALTALEAQQESK